MVNQAGMLDINLSELVELEVERVGVEVGYLRLRLVLDNGKKPSGYLTKGRVTAYPRKSFMIPLEQFKSLSLKLRDAVKDDGPVQLYLGWNEEAMETEEMPGEGDRKNDSTLPLEDEHSDRYDSRLMNATEEEVDDPDYWIDL